jgi:pimeloyl-ACP methyl ester carboxylesterase
MLQSLALFCTLFLAHNPIIQSKCDQAAPAPVNGKWARSKDRAQAVVLIHGYSFLLRDDSVSKPAFHGWQLPDSPLIKELAKNADVFAFAYGQNVDVDTIVKESKLRESIADIRKLGYSEIILVGHSAGGLIARQFVEDFADTGVTRVVQVCSPNAGTPSAKQNGLKSQQTFMDCLTPDSREKSLKARAAKKIPGQVQFLCVVAKGDGTTDGVVPCLSQWTADLRQQGVPAVGVPGTHHVMRNAKMSATLCDLFCAPQPRWSPERVEQARKEIFGK